jgi:hypothetical protein
LLPDLLYRALINASNQRAADRHWQSLTETTHFMAVLCRVPAKQHEPTIRNEQNEIRSAK